MKTSRIILSLLIIFSLSLLAQQEQSTLEKIRKTNSTHGGLFSGFVFDKNSGEELIGASVFIVGTSLGASTDIEGKFQIANIPPGQYDVQISYLGYAQYTVSQLQIVAEQTIDLSIGLVEEIVAGQEVVITAQAIKSGEGAVLAERKKATTIGDAISAEQMRKTPDATSGDALKRVTGVSLVDNKYVFVRGVTDRYNQTTLNGAAVPSSSVDKKSFSFDMLPSNLLDHMNVIKTATPDLPGDFTGGLVQLNTLDFPENRTVKLVLGGALNSITTNQDFNRTQGGGKDWTGADDGTRQFPDGFDSPQALSGLGKALTNSWSPNRSTAPYGRSASLSYADRIMIGEDQVGYLAALTYKNNYQRVYDTLSEFQATDIKRSLSSTKDKYSVSWGGLIDLSYKTEHHKFTLKNNYNTIGEDQYVAMEGFDHENPRYVKSYLTEWEQRTMYTGQLTGEHFLQEAYGMDVDWMLFFAQSKSQMPDRKKLDYDLTYGYDPEADPFTVFTQETGRSWSSLFDKSIGQKLNITVPVEKVKVKVGLVNEIKSRNYSISYFQIFADNAILSGNYEWLTYGPDSIFRQSNFGAGGFSWRPFTKPSDQYSAEHKTFASYALVDVPFSLLSQQFRFTGGVRLENSIQNVYTTESAGSPVPFVSTIAKSDLLPSMNFTYLIDETQNLRIAYSQTVNRPEFREMTNGRFYDFNRYEYVIGNVNLNRALARNYDIRYEIFPDFGDLMAVSYFYKSISFPIEERRDFDAGYSTRTWWNAEQAKNFGWEIEFRKHFGFIDPSLHGLQLVANYSRIYSEVPYKENISNSTTERYLEGTRPMQGQSPYMINISLFYTNATFGTSINVLYNEYGSRIDAIGDIASGDFNIYEHARGVVDLTVTQPLGVLLHGFEAKYSVKNLNNQPVIYTHGENTYRVDRYGVNHSLQFSFNF